MLAVELHIIYFHLNNDPEHVLLDCSEVHNAFNQIVFHIHRDQVSCCIS